MTQVEIRHDITNEIIYSTSIQHDKINPLPVLRGLAVHEAVKQDVSLAHAHLSDVVLTHMDLVGANFACANLSGTSFIGSLLKDVNFTSADLSYAKFKNTSMYDVNFSSSNLAETFFQFGYYLDVAFRDAHLSYTIFDRVDYISDIIIKGPTRSDGYQFFLTRTEPGEFRVKAGCRNFTLTDAREFWRKTRPIGTKLGAETQAILSYMEEIAHVRGWTVWEDEK